MTATASTFASIETPRLILRAWRGNDCAPFAAMNADRHVREFFPGLLTRAESDASVNKFTAHLQTYGFTFWALEEKATGAFAGFTGLLRADFEAHFTPCVEIGWRLAAPFWKRGLASEAARAALSFGFERELASEIVAFAPHNNLRSRRVMERLGMTHDSADDFIHPKMPEDHPLQPCVLYRMRFENFARPKGNANERAR